MKTMHLKIGDYEICPIPTGLFGLDGGAMFGTVPKVLWEKNHPTDDKNRIQMEARALLLKSKDHNILIDTGNGADFVEKYGEKMGGKFAEMYNVTGRALEASLAKFSVTVDDIDTVILTHLHFDHAGGATCARDGKIMPTFPKAKYFVQKENLKTAQTPNLRERASYLPANFEPLLRENVLELLDGEQKNLRPGIHVHISNGHTHAQQIVEVAGPNESLFYCADMIPTASHVRIPWIMGYDLNPLLLMEEKIKLLQLALQKNAYIYFEHDADCEAARVQARGTDFEVAERLHLI